MFLLFHLIKINFVKPEACTIIFSTVSPVFPFMKQRNKKIKIVYVATQLINVSQFIKISVLDVSKKKFFYFPRRKMSTAYFFIFPPFLPPCKTVNLRRKIHLANGNFGQTSLKGASSMSFRRLRHLLAFFVRAPLPRRLLL